MKNFTDGQWLNAPDEWNVTGGILRMKTRPKTDFWRKTYYSFERDSGHFLRISVDGSFTARLRIKGEFRALYDQAGLMIRIDEERWVKTGVEFTDGELFLSTVVTDGKSDWSVSQPFKALEEFYIRVTVNKGAIRIQASKDGKFWPLLRLAPFPEAAQYQVGPMACTPESNGMTAEFSEFEIGPALTTPLHDLT